MKMNFLGNHQKQEYQKSLSFETKRFFVDSMISKFDVLYQYENPPVDDIQYTEEFIKNFASYIIHDIHHIDMLDMVDIKIDEDDYISMKWERDGRSEVPSIFQTIISHKLVRYWIFNTVIFSV